MLRKAPSLAVKDQEVLFSEIEMSFLNALAINPTADEFHYYLGLLYTEYPQFSGSNGFNRAQEQFIKAIVLNKRNYLPRFALAELYVSHDRPDVAKAVLED